MGDFNASLLKYENDTDTADLLDQIYVPSLPHITLPTCVSPRSKTLIVYSQLILMKMWSQVIYWLPFKIF